MTEGFRMTGVRDYPIKSGNDGGVSVMTAKSYQVMIPLVITKVSVITNRIYNYLYIRSLEDLSLTILSKLTRTVTG
jgi:hypothetical protein